MAPDCIVLWRVLTLLHVSIDSVWNKHTTTTTSGWVFRPSSSDLQLIACLHTVLHTVAVWAVGCLSFWQRDQPIWSALAAVRSGCWECRLDLRLLCREFYPAIWCGGVYRGSSGEISWAVWRVCKRQSMSHGHRREWSTLPHGRPSWLVMRLSPIRSHTVLQSLPKVELALAILLLIWLLSTCWSRSVDVDSLKFLSPHCNVWILVGLPWHELVHDFALLCTYGETEVVAGCRDTTWTFFLNAIKE